MRVAYVNTYFKSNHAGGGHVHMGQFVRNATALGHEIWAYPNNTFPQAHMIPLTRLDHIKTMRKMDVLYVRVERKSPEICTWSLPPRRLLYGFPVVVWEFNTIPDEALSNHGRNDHTKSTLRHYGRGCDLAVCVSRALAERVKENLGISRVLIVPNGSDPTLFNPDAVITKRMLPFREKFNIVWVGSGRETWHDLTMLGETAKMIYEMDAGRNIIFHLIGPDLVGIMADMPPNVYYWGAEYYEKLPNWLAGMDVGLDLMEPGSGDYRSPLKLFDYMASSLAVVSTEQPQIREVFEKLGQLDLLVPSSDAQTLAVVLEKLALDRERVKRQGHAGRQMVTDYYNWRRAVQDTMNEIESIFRTQKGKP